MQHNWSAVRYFPSLDAYRRADHAPTLFISEPTSRIDAYEKIGGRKVVFGYYGQEHLPGGQTGFLLIHGLGGTPVEMRYIAQGLARAGYAVHVPQLAGHCRSEEDLRGTGWVDWYETVEDEHRLMRENCDRVVSGGLSMGAILALHHAAQHPQDVSALALYAPSLWLDGWGIPWYASFFALIRQKWLADYVPFAERHPWGIKDPRLRALVEQAITSGDSSQAGIAALPGSLMLELRWLIREVQRAGFLGVFRGPRTVAQKLHPARDSLRHRGHVAGHGTLTIGRIRVASIVCGWGLSFSLRPRRQPADQHSPGGEQFRRSSGQGYHPDPFSFYLIGIPAAPVTPIARCAAFRCSRLSPAVLALS